MKIDNKVYSKNQIALMLIKYLYIKACGHKLTYI